MSTADHATIHYETAGAGPLVLLVHGGTGTGAFDWEHQGLLAQSHRLVIPDLRGHGRSTDPSSLLSLDTIASDMLALIDEVGSPDAIVAFSIGAAAILRLLTKRPELARAFICVGASMRGDPGRVEEIVNAPWPDELRGLRHESSDDPEHWRSLRRSLARSWAETLDISPAQLAAITCPTLVVCGDRDRIEPVETALAISRSIPGAQLLVLPRAGHFAHRDRPDLFNPAAEAFLARALP